MPRLLVLSCAILCCLGCASDSDKAQWEEVLKDLRGDNMQMKSNFSGFEDKDNRQSPPLSR